MPTINQVLGDVFGVLPTNNAVRPELVARRYDGIAVGPRFLYSFEGQSSVPIDGSSALARDLSPFTLRILPPFLASSPTGGSVSTLDSAFSSVSAFNTSAQAASNAAQAGSAYTASSTFLAQRAVANGQEVSQSSTRITVNTLTDGYTALDIAAQTELLQSIYQTSPLTLLINPKELSVSYTSVQSYSARARNGLIFQRWGEQQPQLTFSGSTGAFIAGAGAVGADGQTASVSGVQFASKRDSAAWQNFMALYHFYRNNGYVYDTFGKSEAHLMVGFIAIDYDQWTYYGHIDTFEYSYDETMPHKVDWNLTFTCSRIVDNASSPSSVLPMTAPTQSPSQTQRGRPTTQAGQPDLRASSLFAQTPFDFTFPSGDDLP